MGKTNELEKAITWIEKGHRFVVLRKDFKNQIERLLKIQLKLLKNRKYMVCTDNLQKAS